MAYNIIRLKKLKTALQTGNAENHNFRKNPNIKNVDYTKTNRNIYLVGDDQVNLQQQFLALKEKYNFKHSESKSVKFYEFVVTASPEFFEGKRKAEITQYFKDNLAILKKDFLKVDDSVLSAVIHLDESTPHMHILAVPLVKDTEKTIARGKDKGKVIQGEFYSLSHERIFGKRKDFVKLQNVVNEELKAKGWQVERGLKNSGKKYSEVKDFYKKIEEFNLAAKDDEELKKDLKELTDFTEMSRIKQTLKASEILTLLLKNIDKFKMNFKTMFAIHRQNEKLKNEVERLRERLDQQAETKEQIREKAKEEELKITDEKIEVALTAQKKVLDFKFNTAITEKFRQLKLKQEKIDKLEKDYSEKEEELRNFEEEYKQLKKDALQIFEELEEHKKFVKFVEMKYNKNAVEEYNRYDAQLQKQQQKQVEDEIDDEIENKSTVKYTPKH